MKLVMMFDTEDCYLTSLPIEAESKEAAKMLFNEWLEKEKNGTKSVLFGYEDLDLFDFIGYKDQIYYPDFFTIDEWFEYYNEFK